MKKILVFTGYYVPYMGGLSSHAHEFNEMLSQRGYNITVFTTQLPKNAPEQEKINENLTIIRFPAFEIVPNYPLPKFWKLRFWQLYCNLYKKDPSFVISRIRFFNTSLLALIYTVIKRKKLVHIDHTSNHAILSSAFKTSIAKLYDNTIGWLIFRCSTINISISKAVQNYIYKFNKRPSPIIYRGLNLEELRSIEPDTSYREKYKNKTIITTASRLYKWKGIDYTIDAINSLPDKVRENIVFLLIGDGEDYDRLKKYESDSIVLLGRLPRDETIGILKIADIYIHSSRPGGGLSTSLLEAMYAKCAVIATPNEGADEVIVDKKNGFLIEKPYVQNFAKNIIILTKNPDKISEFGQSAHKTITKKFNWKKSIKKYEKIFDEM